LNDTTGGSVTAPDALESKMRLIVDEMERTVAAATKAEVQARAAKQMLRAGTTIVRVFQIGLAGVKAAGDRMLEAHLATTAATDTEVATSVRNQLEPYLETHLENEGAKGYTTDHDQWNKGVASLWPEAKSYFDQLEDRARAIRHDKDSRDTRLDRMLRRAKDHPALSRVLFLAIVATSIIGTVEVVGKAVHEVQQRMKPAVTAPPSTPPTVAPPSSGATKFAIGDCLLPDAETSSDKVVKVVGIGDNTYRVFTHLISQGQLILAEDYGTRPRATIEAGHARIACPVVEGAFSPAKFIKAGAAP
jgi:hypothetical protein